MIQRYALGCAFNTLELLMNFNYKSLDLTCNDCYKLINDFHRNKLISKIFKFSVKLIITDIVLNNVTFWLPLTGNKKCNIHVRRVLGEEFKNLRRSGKWKNIDIIKSLFSGYELGLYLLGNRTPRIKTIYLSKQYKDILESNVNKGIPYGDNCNDKTIKDYYDLVYKEFPSVSRADINKILNFSWKSLYLHNSYGGDVVITDKDFWCYIGRLKKTPLDHFYYYIKKLTVKLRVLYKRKNIEWDGYYYFALSNSLYLNYILLINKRGRPKKYFKFGTVYLYLILDECKINEHYKKYIFRIPFISKLKIKLFTKDLVSDKAELIITRNPLKFKDILINDNEYEFL